MAATSAYAFGVSEIYETQDVSQNCQRRQVSDKAKLQDKRTAKLEDKCAAKLVYKTAFRSHTLLNDHIHSY